MTAKTVRGSVRILSCNACAAEFPMFDFEVESDADAIGLCSAGKCSGGSLILIELDFDEWQAVQSGELREVPSRFSQVIGDGDYRLAHILRVEQSSSPPADVSFSEFRQKYKAPTVVYSCPCCSSGEAISRSEMAAGEYIDSGGQILAASPLVLER